MIITKEQQEAWVLNYSETHSFDQTTGFITSWMEKNRNF